jgi:hypothetical protein
MEITIIGDDYEFKRDVVNFENINFRKNERLEVSQSNPNNVKTTSNVHNADKEIKPFTFYKFDKRLKQKAIVKIQEFKDIYKFGRRLGNIQYKEDS